MRKSLALARTTTYLASDSMQEYLKLVSDLVISNVEVIITLLFLCLTAIAAHHFYNREEKETIHVIGYDPTIPRFEYKEIEYSTDECTYPVENGEDITFRPVQETSHDTPWGRGWVLDLQTGKTWKRNEEGDVDITTGKELTRLKKDLTVEQAMRNPHGKLEMMLQYAPIFAVLVLVALTIIGVGVFS